MKNSKVFLGGTCNGSTWRDEVIKGLRIEYFNPVVPDWTPECQAEEERQKSELCNIHLYVITPKMTGVFSIAEAVQSSNDKTKKTYFCYLEEDDGATFSAHQIKSLKATADLIERNGGKSYTCINDLIKGLNEER